MTRVFRCVNAASHLWCFRGTQISECIAQLSNHFKPDPRHIKKRIEDLITREYIERDNDKQSLYRYVA